MAASEVAAEIADFSQVEKLPDQELKDLSNIGVVDEDGVPKALSQHLGERLEGIGGRILEEALGEGWVIKHEAGFVPVAIVNLDRPEILNSAKGKVPDAVVIERNTQENKFVLRACDFKLNLEDAYRIQVEGEHFAKLVLENLQVRRAIFESLRGLGFPGNEAAVKGSAEREAKMYEEKRLAKRRKTVELTGDTYVAYDRVEIEDPESPIIIRNGFFLTPASSSNRNYFGSVHNLGSPGEAGRPQWRIPILTEEDAQFFEITSAELLSRYPEINAFKEAPGFEIADALAKLDFANLRGVDQTNLSETIYYARAAAASAAMLQRIRTPVFQESFPDPNLDLKSALGGYLEEHPDVPCSKELLLSLKADFTEKQTLREKAEQALALPWENTRHFVPAFKRAGFKIGKETDLKRQTLSYPDVEALFEKVGKVHRLAVREIVREISEESPEKLTESQLVALVGQRIEPLKDSYLENPGDLIGRGLEALK